MANGPLARSKTFEDVGVWQKAHALVLAVYRFSATFPPHETFGLRSQLRRSAISVPANFAEGFRKRGHSDKVRFYNIAQGSLEESRYYLMLARDLGYGETRSLLAAADEVGRMLHAYMMSVG
jgi:four helix bundle protein